MAKNDDLDQWPAIMRAVFTAVGVRMGDKRLTPETLVGLPASSGDIVAEHHVAFSNISASDLGQKRGRYIIVISGPRLDGRWSFESGQLERLARSSAASANHD